MMKKIFGLLFCLLIAAASFAQVKIHSHNDYTHAKPLLQAYAYQAYQIEVDVFLIGDSLIVAHSKKDKNLSRTINTMYLDPIANLTKDEAKRGIKSKYDFRLMIDLKDSWDVVYPVLRKEIEKYGDLFDRGKNKNAVQIVISGNRPADSLFHTFPTWVYFDGLPNISYAKADLKRVTMISDNFANYAEWKGVGEIPEADKIKLLAAVKQANKLHRPFRFWGAPDTQDCWRQLKEMGVVIINTDKIVECKTYFEK